MLVVHVQTPEAPNLDLLDTPGFVQFGAKDEPDNMSAMTRVRWSPPEVELALPVAMREVPTAP